MIALPVLLRRRSRGVALLAALLMVAIATAIAAAIFFDTGLVLRRAEGASVQERAQLVAGGAEALAASVLAEDLDTGDAPVHGAQRWASAFGPLELEDGGSVQGQLVDLQGRFNLNSLIDKDGKVEPVSLELFERLLRNLGLEPIWATRLADWLDADDQPLAGGGEDDLYTSMLPGYRPPNRPVTSISELLLLPGFDRGRLMILAPHVAALPRDAAINLCSATPPLLDALANERQWVGAEESLARNRERDCFPRREAFRSAMPTTEQFDRIDRAVGLAERSRYFQLRSVVGVGTTRVSLYSLLRFESTPPEPPRVRVMLRHLAD